MIVIQGGTRHIYAVEDEAALHIDVAFRDNAGHVRSYEVTPKGPSPSASEDSSSVPWSHVAQ